MCACSPDAAITAFSAVKPDYLADIHSLDSSQIARVEQMTFRGGLGTCTINAKKFVDETSYDHYLEAGKVYEYELVGTDGHPFHLHVNSFQIVEVSEDADNYYRPGDWHDVLLNQGRIRFQTADFTGTAVIHCHILVHEDTGCMITTEITGADGTRASIKSTYNTLHLPTEEEVEEANGSNSRINSRASILYCMAMGVLFAKSVLGV